MEGVGILTVFTHMDVCAAKQGRADHDSYGHGFCNCPDGHHQYYIFLSQPIVHALDYEHLDEVMLLIQTCNQECSIPLCFSIGNSQKVSYFQ